MATCECCDSRALTAVPRVVLWAGQQWRTTVCQDCADGEHARQACFLCGAGVWHCQRLDHVRRQHPQWLAAMEDDPDPHGLEAVKAAAPKLIGSVRW